MNWLCVYHSLSLSLCLRDLQGGSILSFNRLFYDEHWSKHRVITCLDWSPQVGSPHPLTSHTCLHLFISSRRGIFFLICTATHSCFYFILWLLFCTFLSIHPSSRSPTVVYVWLPQTISLTCFSVQRKITYNMSNYFILLNTETEVSNLQEPDVDLL